MVRAQIIDGKLIPMTEEDAAELREMFPDGRVVLNSDNCPEIAEAIDRISAELLEQNREAYEALAHHEISFAK